MPTLQSLLAPELRINLAWILASARMTTQRAILIEVSVMQPKSVL